MLSNRTLFYHAVATALLILPPAAASPVAAQRASAPLVLDSAVLAGYQWRNLGPDRGGRSIAVSGVRGQPDVAYFGAAGGGLWKTEDGGVSWRPVTDGQITSASVGAVAVSETNPDIVFIGTGESCIRGNIMPGDGIYRSRDAGKTWTRVGFAGVDAISKIRIHPTNPDVVFAAVFGEYATPSEERGVFRSTDGGDTWQKVLYRDANTGAVDLVIDPSNPDVIYAALWEAYRKEYTMSSGGPGSGLFRSTDGGETWTELTRNEGLPPEGMVGRIGVAVSPADPDRVYALVEHADGGLFSSDDAGATWTRVNDDRSIRQRSFYYTHIFADPVEADVVYLENTALFRSEDGGKTLDRIGGTHGDFHDLWIDPDDPAHMVVGNDGGGAVTRNTGDDWTDEDYSTAQFYHVITTAHIPYHVCGAQQDNSTFCLPSDWNDGSSRDGQAAGSTELGYRAGGGEPGYIAPDPRDIDIYYAGTNNGGYVDRYDRRLDIHREVNPYPWFYSGEPSSAVRERWQWTFPILFSPVDRQTLYVSSQRLWSTRDGGKSWNALSGDLTRHDPATMGPSGGPITHDMNGPEMYATIFAVGPGRKNLDVIWTGSDDGLVHVTRDGGETWTNVTPPGMPEYGRVSQIDASSFSDDGAYVSVRRPLLDDQSPYIFRTRDGGASWTKIVNGIRPDAYVHAVRQDPKRQGLLYAATQHGVYISYDDGDHWQDLSLNLPDVPVADLVVADNDLVIASHGRGFWILDDIAALREAQAGMTTVALDLFTPPLATRSGGDITFTWWAANAADSARLEILDAQGDVVRAFISDTTTADSAADSANASDDDEDDDDGRGRRGGGGNWLTTDAGLSHVTWDLRGEPYITFPGMIFWGARASGPAVPPGNYTVRLSAGGRTVSEPLTVRRNPLIEGVTDEDLIAQYRFSSAVRDEVTVANNAVIAIRRVKTQLEDRYEQSDDPRLHETGDRLLTNASDVESDIYQVKNRSGQDPLNFPIRVNNRLANLMSMAERGDGRPTNNMPEIFEILKAELDGYTDRLDRIWATDLAAVNRELLRLGLEPIDAGCYRIDGCRPVT